MPIFNALQALLLSDEMKLDEILAVMCVQGALQEVRAGGEGCQPWHRLAGWEYAVCGVRGSSVPGQEGS